MGLETTRIERLLTVSELAEQLGTTERFPRRLVAERRIRFVKVGKYVRFPESAVQEFLDDSTIDVVVRPQWQ